MKNIFATIVFSLVVTFQHFFFNPDGLERTEVKVIEDSILTATLCFTGDVMCHSTQFNYAKVGADTFDFTGVYCEVKKYLSEPEAMDNLSIQSSRLDVSKIWINSPAITMNSPR